MDIQDIIIIILIVIAIILFFKKNKEKYDGLSYVDDYEYTKCCNLYGCNSFNCQYFLHQRQSPYILIGAIVNDKKTIKSLFRRYNLDTKLYEYYYLKDKNDPKFILIPTDGSELMNNDKIQIDKEDYKVYVHNVNTQITNNYDYYNYLNTYPKYTSFDNVYTNRIIKPIIGPAGIVVSEDESKKYVIMEQILNPKHHEYSYQVNINDVLVPIDRNKILNDGDKVKIPALNEVFTFRKDKRIPILY
jgi:hypothetical protein